MNIIQRIKPTAALLDLQETKEYLRVNHSLEDALITSLIDAAQQYLEGPDGILGRTILRQSWTGRIDPWAEVTATVMEIPLPPLISIDAIRYVDNSGAADVWGASSYRVQNSGYQPARLLAAETWPRVGEGFGAMELDFTAGYGGPESVPDNIIAAARMIVADFYDNRAAASDRQGYENRTVTRLLNPLKVWYV